jgi:hypothetical protein
LATIAFFGLLSVGMAFIIATAVFSDIEEKGEMMCVWFGLAGLCFGMMMMGIGYQIRKAGW